MKTGPLFLKLTECTKKLIVCQGGGDAGKTVAILQRLAIKSINKKGQVSTVASQTIPAAKAGALRAFQKYVLPYVAKYIVKYNETERTYFFYNGSILEFKSYRDELAAQGSERDNLFMNECNHEDYNTFWQLERKTRDQVFLDYNPTHPFWVHDKVLPGDGQERKFFNKVQLYISDHRHNPFLSAEDHEAYETISDPDLFRVYSRGLTGKIKGLVLGHFKEWFEPFPINSQRYVYGIDYGYTNDPTAIIKMAVDGRRRVVQELAYESGIPAETIKNILIHSGWKPGQDIFSEADPNMINQIIMLGVTVYPAIKGPGSIAAGISKSKEHECFYTTDSKNFKAELGVYKWIEATDVITGKNVLTNQPVDAWNHCCDAYRMADYTDSFRNRSK